MIKRVLKMLKRGVKIRLILSLKLVVPMKKNKKRKKRS